jgi:RNA polymerase primary sigma factor
MKRRQKKLSRVREKKPRRRLRAKSSPARAARTGLKVVRAAQRLQRSEPSVAVAVAPPAVEHGYEPAARVSSESPQPEALQLYLREIGQVKLLTPAEEIVLARRIRKGDAQAREHMIKANLRLVVKIARDYEGLGLPLLDLINEGNIGLMKGVERFDPRKGAKLSTYSAWWIKQSIKRALANQSKTIRLPVHVVDKVAAIRRAEMKLRDVFGRDPTDEEIAAEVELKPQRVREYRQAAKAPVSLEAPLGSDEDSEPISEVIADTGAAAPSDHLMRQSDTELMREVFGTLSKREQSILTLRYGLDDDTPRTLEEIGQRFGVTRERIRQIQNEAIKKLKAHVRKRDKLPVQPVIALAE